MRNKKIDFVKGIAAFLVLWGHTIEWYAESQLWNDKVHIFIYSFHMPLFMFLSGYVFFYSLKKKWYDIAIKRSLYLLIPIVVWGTESFLRSSILGKTGFLFEDWIMSVTAAGLWFLYAVIVNNVITITVVKMTNSSLARIAMFTGIFGLMLLSCEFIHSMRMITYMYPYFIVGMYCNQSYSMKVKKISNIVITLMACIFPILLLYFSENAYIYVSGIALGSSEIGATTQIIYNIYRWIIGFAGIAFCYKALKSIDFSSGFIDKMCWMGKRSLQFYALNSMVIYWINHLINLVMNLSYSDNFRTHCTILGITIIEVEVIILINKCVEKSKVIEFVLFGRKN